MQVNGRPVAAFDPEGLVFSAGVDSEMIKLYDLRSFDKVRSIDCIVYNVGVGCMMTYFTISRKLACVAGGIRGHKRGSLKYRLPKN